MSADTAAVHEAPPGDTALGWAQVPSTPAGHGSPPRQPALSSGEALAWVPAAPAPQPPPRRPAPAPPLPVDGLAAWPAARTGAARRWWWPTPRRSSVSSSPDEELAVRRLRSALTRAGGQCRTIAVISAKGGVGKTTTVMSLGHVFASHSCGGGVMAVDCNPDAGTLGWRAAPHAEATLARHLRGLDRRVGHGIGAVDACAVRTASGLRVLAAPSDPPTATSPPPDAEDYRRLLDLLAAAEDIVVCDCASGILDPLAQRVVAAAAQLVVVTAPTAEAARATRFLLGWLSDHGHGPLTERAVLVVNGVSAPSAQVEDLERGFAAHVAAVVRVPYDPQLSACPAPTLPELAPATRWALLELACELCERWSRRPAAAAVPPPPPLGALPPPSPPARSAPPWSVPPAGPRQRRAAGSAGRTVSAAASTRMRLGAAVAALLCAASALLISDRRPVLPTPQAVASPVAGGDPADNPPAAPAPSATITAAAGTSEHAGGSSAEPAGMVDCPRPAPLRTAQPGEVVLTGDLQGRRCPSLLTWSPQRRLLSVLDPAGAPQVRYELGAVGDQAVLGDWDCDRVDTPALYRPATGELFVFHGWARPGAAMAGETVAGLPAGGEAVIVPGVGDGAGCADTVEVTGARRGPR